MPKRIFYMRKKEKNAAKNLKKKKRESLITAVAALALTLLCLVCIGICIYHACLPTPAYDDLTSKDYTFVRYEKRNGSSNYIKDYQIYMFVKEEAKPLLIQNTHVPKIEKELKKLQKNDSLHCYIQSSNHPDCMYEIMEIESNSPIMTLHEYNQIASQNSIGSIILLTILTFIMVILTVIEYNRYKKLK